MKGHNGNVSPDLNRPLLPHGAAPNRNRSRNHPQFPLGRVQSRRRLRNRSDFAVISGVDVSGGGGRGGGN